MWCGTRRVFSFPVRCTGVPVDPLEERRFAAGQALLPRNRKAIRHGYNAKTFLSFHSRRTRGVKSSGQVRIQSARYKHDGSTVMGAMRVHVYAAVHLLR